MKTETGGAIMSQQEKLSPAAKRALSEAGERQATATAELTVKEINGRAGPEPVRYGDWEVKGVAVDF